MVEISTKDVSKLSNLKHLHINEVNVFEEKKPTFGFRKLGMGGRYKGVIFSNWITSLANIVKITLDGCKGLKYLPSMERLPFLMSITICSLHELEYIYYEEPHLPETFFPYLQSLVIRKCNKLKGWKMRDDVGDDYDNSSHLHNLSIPPFPPSLSNLIIIKCQLLTRLPAFPYLNKKLKLYGSNMETLMEATLNMPSSECLIEFPPLSMLKDWTLGKVYRDVKKLPKNCMRNLSSLEFLCFMKLPNQTFEEIAIWFKEEFNYLPSLQKIEFWHCPDLNVLPDWIFNISSIQHITIADCIYLDSLPEGMPRLAKLQTLEIIRCPLLLEECKTQTSETWHKIAHIPNIILKRFSF
jgi:hypothetical protein